jgi:hypothetical protein
VALPAIVDLIRSILSSAHGNVLENNIQIPSGNEKLKKIPYAI